MRITRHGKLEFKHRTNKEVTGLSYMTSLVIQALKTLGKNNVTPEVIQILSTKLSLSEKQACLKEAKEFTDWVYDTMRQICGGNILIMKSVHQLEKEINSLR